MILIKDLVKQYNESDESIALKGINLTLPNSGLVSILGPSGCGKSTLLNLIGLLDRPTSGDIVFDNFSSKELTSNQEDKFRNEKFGFIFQSYHLIPTLSILDNVTLPLEVQGKIKSEEQKNIATEYLRKFGLEKTLNKKVNELSGGMRQRVAIARALILNPDVILADEPTGALDSKNGIEVMEILKEISKTKLVLLVTHNEKEAKQFSDRIIRMCDGTIVEDSSNKDTIKDDNVLGTITDNSKTSINKLMKTKNISTISMKSFMSKKLKTIFTSVANCFGLVTLGFVLSITNGFNEYKNRADNSTASNLPINVPAYSVKSATQNWEDINQTEKYPNKDELYPFLSGASTISYTYNNYSKEYFDLLDSLKSEGLISDYLLNYGNDYNYNLSTYYPDSIRGQYKGKYAPVYTNLDAGSSFTSSTYGIPTNIFHVLYGDIDLGYDLIAGEMPKNKNDLVLVCNEYNSINFETLQNLGFYNAADKREDVQNLSSESKVKPLKFDDIIGKTYKIFSHDELYEKDSVVHEVYDLFNYKMDGVPLPTPNLIAKPRKIATYHVKDYATLYEDKTLGTELKITGILRPKKESTLSLISPSLCYLPELQEELNANKKETKLVRDFTNNLVYMNEEPTNHTAIVQEVKKLMIKYKNDVSSISPAEINELANKYFKYYYIDSNSGKEFDKFAIGNFSNFLTASKYYGVDLINKETREILSSGNIDSITEFIEKMLRYFKASATADLAYEYFISLVAFVNSYTDVVNVSIFPAGLFERSIVLRKLDTFNDSRASESEKIYYFDQGNFMIEQVGNMVSLVSLVLMIFVCVLITVACVMNILFTYNNVLERKKDIGIFRAIGMRKFDVSRVFIFEASIIGGLSGLMACLLAYLLQFPVNYEVQLYYTDYWNIGNICILTWWHCLLMIALGLSLGIVSAIVPSYYAANKDPVACLKDE